MLNEQDRPSVLYRPTLSLNNDTWLAKLGEDLTGVGCSPEEAMRDFDRIWYGKPLPVEPKSASSKETPPEGTYRESPVQVADKTFFNAWNATDGTIKVDWLDWQTIAQNDRARRYSEQHWLDAYPRALAKFPLKFYGSAGMPVTKFLQQDTVGQILAGKYDISVGPEPKEKPESLDSLMEVFDDH